MGVFVRGGPQNGNDFRALKPFLPQTRRVRSRRRVVRKTNDGNIM